MLYINEYHKMTNIFKNGTNDRIYKKLLKTDHITDDDVKVILKNYHIHPYQILGLLKYKFGYNIDEHFIIKFINSFYYVGLMIGDIYEYFNVNITDLEPFIDLVDDKNLTHIIKNPDNFNITYELIELLNNKKYHNTLRKLVTSNNFVVDDRIYNILTYANFLEEPHKGYKFESKELLFKFILETKSIYQQILKKNIHFLDDETSKELYKLVKQNKIKSSNIYYADFNNLPRNRHIVKLYVKYISNGNILLTSIYKLIEKKPEFWKYIDISKIYFQNLNRRSSNLTQYYSDCTINEIFNLTTPYVNPRNRNCMRNHASNELLLYFKILLHKNTVSLVDMQHAKTQLENISLPQNSKSLNKFRLDVIKLFDKYIKDHKNVEPIVVNMKEELPII